MANWRDKSDRDNLVASSSRSSEFERVALLEKKIADLHASQRGVPSWLAFASVFAFSLLGALIGFLALYNSESLEARLSAEIESQIASTEAKIEENSRAIVDAIARIERTTSASRRDTIADQLMLQTLGYEITLTGLVDQQTSEATRAFQRDRGLTEDGRIGPLVRAALLEALQE